MHDNDFLYSSLFGNGIAIAILPIHADLPKTESISQQVAKDRQTL